MGETLLQPGIGKQRITGIHRLGHPVRIQEQPIALAQHGPLRVERRLVHDPERHAAGVVEELDPAVLP